MSYNESDDKSIIFDEIRNVKEDISNLDKAICDLVFKRKMLFHKLSDLQDKTK